MNLLRRGGNSNKTDCRTKRKSPDGKAKNLIILQQDALFYLLSHGFAKFRMINFVYQKSDIRICGSCECLDPPLPRGLIPGLTALFIQFSHNSIQVWHYSVGGGVSVPLVYQASFTVEQGCQTWEFIPRSWEFFKVMGFFLRFIFSKKTVG